MNGAGEASPQCLPPSRGRQPAEIKEVDERELGTTGGQQFEPPELSNENLPIPHRASGSVHRDGIPVLAYTVS